MDLTSQTTFLSVAALGLAVCAGIYILWGPDNWFRKRGPLIIKYLAILHRVPDACMLTMQVVVLALPILETRVS